MKEKTADEIKVGNKVKYRQSVNVEVYKMDNGYYYLRDNSFCKNIRLIPKSIINIVCKKEQ